MSEALKLRLAAIGIKVGQRAVQDMRYGEHVYDCHECRDMGLVYVEVRDPRLAYHGLEVRPCFGCRRGARKHGQPGSPCTWADRHERHCPHCGASPGDMIPAGWTYTGPPGMSYADAAEWRHVHASRKPGSTQMGPSDTEQHNARIATLLSECETVRRVAYPDKHSTEPTVTQ